MSKEDEYWSLLCLAEEQRDKAEKERDALRAEIDTMKQEHAIWEKHSLCEIVKERDRLREALEKECYCTDGGTHPSTCNPCEVIKGLHAQAALVISEEKT